MADILGRREGMSLPAALAALPDEAGAPARPPIGAAFRDLMATPPVELRDSS